MNGHLVWSCKRWVWQTSYGNLRNHKSGLQKSVSSFWKRLFLWQTARHSISGNDLAATMDECREVTEQYSTGRSAYLRLGQLLMRLFAGIIITLGKSRISCTMEWEQQNYYKDVANFNYGSFNLSKNVKYSWKQPCLCFAGGGNTSVKDDTTLYVKRLRYTACQSRQRNLEMSRARLNETTKTDYPEDDVKRESPYLADVILQ